MDSASCPQCGLGEKEALLKAADLYWAEGKQKLAVDYYGRYLSLEPGDFETACKNASRLSAMAREQRDPQLFEKADGQLVKILQGHWDWQGGHQSRIDLHFCFGKLDSLLAEYQKAAEQDPSRAARCGEMIRLIQLVRRFKDEQPAVPESLKGEEDFSLFLKSFFPLLLGILVTWFFTAVYPPSFQEPASRKEAFLEVGSFAAGILGLGMFGIWRYQKNRKQAPSKPRRTLQP